MFLQRTLLILTRCVRLSAETSACAASATGATRGKGDEGEGEGERVRCVRRGRLCGVCGEGEGATSVLGVCDECDEA